MTEQKTGPDLTGLTSAQVERLQVEYGKNELIPEKRKRLFREILEALSEPMFLLLMAAAVIYVFLGEPRDGLIMLFCVFGTIGIDVFQEYKTDRTLKALKDLSSPRIKVIRDGVEKIISSSDLVPGDLMMVVEGVKIPADGIVVRANDLCVDESSLTGEAEGVWKIANSDSEAENNEIVSRDYCYAGTLVTQGSAVVCVQKTGGATEYGKIGKNIARAPEKPTPLQKQTGEIVKLSAGAAAVLLALVSCFTWLNLPDHLFKDRLIESILSGITLAMAMIPEEFPVILTVFLSMGAWRLAQKKSLVRKLPSIETLGSVSVLCVDKTGTITMNHMAVRELWAADGDEAHLCRVMGMACETDVYDPMEKAMLEYCENRSIDRRDLFGGQLIKEYPFTSEAKMMGHVWKRGNNILVAAKGSPERILTLCGLSRGERDKTEKMVLDMAGRGLRVIAVGRMELGADAVVPGTLDQCRLEFCGLIGLADPPRVGVKEEIRRCAEAGVRVVMITGDNGVTAGAIARQIGMDCGDKVITGDELNKMSDDELRSEVRYVNVFSRVVPEHKMRIVRAFQENGAIVAMTGDGVNDAPALKYADIGIAMGKRGSEVSREAADLILLDDNFSTIVDTVRDGRRIYDNIKKAVGYVFSIHIPIALTCLLAPVLGVSPANLMLFPLHVMLLELVIDPTCSIVLERQPAEKNIMSRPPRDPKEKLISVKALFKSFLQGITVFAASFGTYFTVMQMNIHNSAATARSMGLGILFVSNLLLVLVNSSHTDFAYQSFKRLLKEKVMWGVAIGTILGLVLILYTPLSGFLKLTALSGWQLLAVVGISAVSVLWFELVKLFHALKKKS